MNNDEYRAKLEKELKILEREMADSDQIVADMQARRRTLEKKVSSLRNTIATTKPKNIVVTDHAVLRYLEREHGIGVEEVREEIMERLRGAENIGILQFQGFVIRGNHVVTYVPPNEGTT